MESNKKDTFDSLNNRINSYKDILEILEGLLNLYKSCFEFEKQDCCINNFIIDYGVNIIEKCKQEGLRIFHNILSQDISDDNYTINNIEYGEFQYVLEHIERFIFSSFNLFIDIMDLEISTFLEKNEVEISELSSYMDMTSMDYVKRLISDLIEKTMRKSKKIVTDGIILKIEEFNRNLLRMKKEIRDLMLNQENKDPEFFIEQVLHFRNGYLERIEELQKSIEGLIEEKFFKSSIKHINRIIQYEIQQLIDQYKEDLNNCFILMLVNKEESNDGSCCVNTKIIDDKESYLRCWEILSIELEHLRLGLRLGVNNFIVLEAEIKANLESVFYNEFYSLMYAVQSKKDFTTMIEAFKTKVNYILYNMTVAMFKFFTMEYHKSISLMMKTRIDSIEKLYFFKPVRYMGIAKIYNLQVVIELQKKLYAIYGTYNFKENMDKEIEEIFEGSKILITEVEKLIDTFINKLQIEGSDAELSEDKEAFQENINKLKSELWRILDSKFIYKFDYLNEIIGRYTEIIKREMKLYENQFLIES